MGDHSLRLPRFVCSSERHKPTHPSPFLTATIENQMAPCCQLPAPINIPLKHQFLYLCLFHFSVLKAVFLFRGEANKKDTSVAPP